MRKLINSKVFFPEIHENFRKMQVCKQVKLDGIKLLSGTASAQWLGTRRDETVGEIRRDQSWLCFIWLSGRNTSYQMLLLAVEVGGGRWKSSASQQLMLLSSHSSLPMHLKPYDHTFNTCMSRCWTTDAYHVSSCRYFWQSNSIQCQWTWAYTMASRCIVLIYVYNRLCKQSWHVMHWKIIFTSKTHCEKSSCAVYQGFMVSGWHERDTWTNKQMNCMNMIRLWLSSTSLRDE